VIDFLALDLIGVGTASWLFYDDIDATETAGDGDQEICAPAASFSPKTTNGEGIEYDPWFGLLGELVIFIPVRGRVVWTPPARTWSSTPASAVRLFSLRSRASLTAISTTSKTVILKDNLNLCPAKVLPQNMRLHA